MVVVDTDAVWHMTREEFNRWIELDPEERPDRGPPVRYGPIRWRPPRPRPAAQMEDILARIDRRMLPEDLRKDQRRHNDPFDSSCIEIPWRYSP